MSVTLIEKDGGRLLEVDLHGKLSKEDYDLFAPEVERQIEKNGKVDMLVKMDDFHGWDAGALWEDVKFDLKHFSDVEHLALVGDKKWEKGMSAFCKPFTTAEVKYFDKSEEDHARQWISEKH
ncbi:MAG: STAS/SEC14 domain-containing protein, partial [Halochromatium sp.]